MRGSRKSQSLSRVSLSCKREAFSRRNSQWERWFLREVLCYASHISPSRSKHVVRNGQKKGFHCCHQVLVLLILLISHVRQLLIQTAAVKKIERKGFTFSSIFLNILVTPCVRCRQGVSARSADGDPRMKCNIEDEVSEARFRRGRAYFV